MSVSEHHQQDATFSSADPFPGVSDAQLRSTMDNFLEKGDTDQPNVWNAATVAGIAMFLVSTIYILHLIGLDIVPGIGGAFVPLAIVGALLVGFVGFGFFVGDRKRVKQILKKQKAKSENYFNHAFPADGREEEDIDLEAELFNDSSTAGKTSRKYKADPVYEDSDFGRGSFDNYAAKKPKKLHRSRTSKKIAGVCGGLADYFGISVTLIRVLFVVAFFAGSGASMLLYIALMIVLDKEPKKPLPDYDF